MPDDAGLSRRGPGGTIPPPTTPPPNPTTPPPHGGDCMAVYKVINSWPDGFQGEVKIMNHTTATWAGWTTSWPWPWPWPSGQSITQLWNGTHTSSGAAVTVTNASYNSTVDPGGTTAFGFLTSTTGSNALPTVTCTGH